MKHQWIDMGDTRVYRVCSQCGYRILVSRGVDPVAAMAVEDCPGRVDPVLLTLSSAAREEQLAARAELRAVCRAFLTSGEPRDPVAAEMIVESALEYLSGEERVGA